MTVALYVLGCLLVGGGTVLFLLAAPGSEWEPPETRAAFPPMPLAGGRPPSPGRHPDLEPVDDFELWEHELLSACHLGREQDQRGRRELERWERESRRRRRERGR